MQIAYPEPSFPKGTSIYVSEPAVPIEASSQVIQAMKESALSSKANYNQVLETNLQGYFQLPVACSVSNGYAGLYVILKTLKLQTSFKNQVILPDATMVAVLNAVLDNQLEPILVDNQTEHINPSAEMFISKVTNKTRAIIVTHTFGVPVLNFEKLVEYCFQNDIYLIEDIAEALGVRYQGKLLGTFGHFCSASLYANKLITCGDGGFILSKLESINDKPLKEYWICIINHGFSKGFHFNHVVQTGNYRINGLGAAFASNFPRFIESFIDKRKKIDAIYRQQLTNSSYYKLMEDNSGGENTPWVFSLRVKDHHTLVSLRQHLANFGIETRPFFKPIHTQPFFKTAQTFPNSIIQYRTGLYLPTYQELAPQMQKYIANTVNNFFKAETGTSFVRFEAKTKRLIDILSEVQIQQLIDNLTQQTQKGQKSQLLSRSNGIVSKLKKLGNQIQTSQKLQIKRIQIKATEKNNESNCLSNKVITIRQENNLQNFGKICVTFDRKIKEFLPLYRAYFEVKQSDGKCIVWQKQENKQNSIENLSDFNLKILQHKLAHKIATQLSSFHKISQQLGHEVLSQLQQRCLADDFQQIKDYFSQNLSKFNVNKHLNCLLQSLIQDFIEKEKLLKAAPLRIVHSRCTPEKIIFEEETDTLTIIDFENVTINQFIVDLAIYEEKHSINQIFQGVIDEYLKLAGLQQEASSIKSRIDLIKISNLLKSLETQSDVHSLKFRQKLRKIISQVMNLYWKNTTNIQRQQLSDFLRDNFEQIHFDEIIEKKLDTGISMAWNHHHGGWKYIEHLICTYFSSKHSKITFISAIEKSFYNNLITEPIQDKWCGFIHNVPLTMQNLCTNLQTLFNDSNFINSLNTCQGIFCLTKQIQQRFCQEFPHIPCSLIPYALTPPTLFFDPFSSLSEDSIIHLVHVGEYLRDVEFFKKVKIGSNCRKYIIECQDIKEGEQGQESKEISIDEKNTQDTMFEWVKELSPEKYEEMLSKSVVFVFLTGAGGCTTVVECIARNTPLLINRLPALQQYLGKDYPLFYQSREHVEALLRNNLKEKLWQTYYYLMNMDKKSFYPQHFLETMHKSYIYQMLQVPNQEKQDFKQYDISILLISYKRQHNIKKIVARLAEQTFSGTIELIIWNNNPQYSLRFIASEFKSRFANLSIIESTFNYYCFVRSAIANLARGKYLLFTDDDVIPKSNFVQSFHSSFQEVQKEYKNYDVVTTLKGNTFHNIHPAFDIEFWSNFDNIHFISPQDDQEQIDVIHMDTCMMKRSLMLKCAAYQIPELEYILVDDYWYSFIFSKYLKAKIIKIKLTENIFEECPTSEDPGIALYKQSKTLKQKNRFFAYHYLRHWPPALFQDEVQKSEWEHCHQIQHGQLRQKQKEKCLQVYKQSFAGFNAGSGLWKNCLNHLYYDCKCEVVRIGVVDKEKQFLCFFQKNGIYLNEVDKIKEKLRKVDKIYSQKNIKYIITLGNIPGSNQYSRQNAGFTQSWRSTTCLEQLYLLWQIIAEQYASKEFCIGYDLINEPACSTKEEVDQLITIYKNIIDRVRTVDKSTPIILEPPGAHHSNLSSFVRLAEQQKLDDNLIYSFHFYDPYVWTSARYRQQEATYQYPGPIPESAGINSSWSINTKIWNKEHLESIFRDIQSIKVELQLQDYQIVMTQYGCRIDRKGITEYFTDLHDLCKQFNISRLAYAYREEWWPKMNYQNHPQAFKIILNDITSTKKYVDFDFLVKKCLTSKNSEVLWLDYDPFCFEIRQNQEKQSSRRIPLMYNFESKGAMTDIEPIFIVGCGRSGTTFLLKCLSFGSDLICLHEPLQFWLDIFPEFNIWSQENYQILHVGANFYEKSKARCEKIKEIYLTLLAKTNKILIVDKQPQNVFKLQFLRLIFPKMKVIYIERQMENVCESISKFQMEQWYGRSQIKFQVLLRESQQEKLTLDKKWSDMREMAKIQWMESKKAMQRFKANRYLPQLQASLFQLTFQNLTSNTYDVLKRLCRFLKLDAKQTEQICEGGTKILIKK